MPDNPKISICIPAYEMHGMGVKFLKELLDSIVKQSYSNLEVVVSDHSTTDDIRNLVESYFTVFARRSSYIIYCHFKEKKGNSSANINNAIKNSSGDIIKPMFQDDFFHSNEALFYIAEALKKNPESSWGAVGFAHTNEESGEMFDPRVPYFNDNILTGYNTVGCPTDIFFKRNDLLFDENLIWLMDCEYYHNLYKHYGNPLIIDKSLVTIRIWSQSVTNEISHKIKNKEKEYVLDKYKEINEKVDE